MKTYILVKSSCSAINAEDIKVNEILGIFQNESKAFWECREINLNAKDNSVYVLKEINLETNEIQNSYRLNDKNSIIDQNEKLYKIPVFYENINIKKNNSSFL